MASDPQADRIRLVIEPGDEEPKVTGPDGDRSAHRRPEDMIDLGRLDVDPDYEFEDEEEAPARRRILPVGLAAIALAGFGAITWYAYQGVVGSMSDETIPLIEADAGPIKTRPAIPGGIDVPHQERLVLNDIAPNPDKPQVERLLPPPEVPKPPVTKGERMEEAGLAATPSPGDRTGNTLADVAGVAQGDLALTPAQRSPEGQEALKSAAPDGGGADKAAVQVPSDPIPTPKNLAAPPKTEAPPQAPSLPAQAAQTAAIPGGFLVQFASLKDKNLVGGEWVRLQNAFPKLLADKKLVLQQADLGSRGVFHRVRAGYFPDRKAAAELCQALKAKNQACIVVKP